MEKELLVSGYRLEYLMKAIKIFCALFLILIKLSLKYMSNALSSDGDM